MTDTPIAPEAPRGPFWPISAELDLLDVDFERQHPDYLEAP